MDLITLNLRQMTECLKKSQTVKGIRVGNSLAEFVFLLSGSENGWHHLVVLLPSEI